MVNITVKDVIELSDMLKDKPDDTLIVLHQRTEEIGDNRVMYAYDNSDYGTGYFPVHW